MIPFTLKIKMKWVFECHGNSAKMKIKLLLKAIKEHPIIILSVHLFSSFKCPFVLEFERDDWEISY